MKVAIILMMWLAAINLPVDMIGSKYLLVEIEENGNANRGKENKSEKTNKIVMLKLFFLVRFCNATTVFDQFILQEIT